MSEPDLSHIPVVIPEGKDGLDDLLMGEFDGAENHLGCDFIEAFRGKVPGKRAAAMIELAYRWAKRSDPKAQRETFRKYTFVELAHALRLDEDDDEESPDPTGSSGNSSDEQSVSSSPLGSDATPTTSSD